MKNPAVPAQGLRGLQVCAISLAGYDPPAALHGPLYKARRAYYENGSRVRVSLVTCSRGITTRYHGLVSHAGLKWKESSETGAFCRSFRLRGQDICLSYDARGCLTRRTVYQNAGWIRTDYFSVKDGVHPLVSLVADDTQDRLLRYDRIPDRELPVYTRQVLLPLKLETDTAIQSYVNTEIGEPSVVLARTDGDYVYCTADEKSRREQLAAQGLPPALLEELVLTPSDPVQTAPPGFDESPEEESPEEATEPPVQEEEPAVRDLPACEPEGNELPMSEEFPEVPVAEEPEIPEEIVPAAQPPQPVHPIPLDGEEEAENEALFSSLLAQRGGEVVFSRGDTRYRYTGGMMNGLRDGRGRTEQENGLTAYDGEYVAGLRDGFGSLYYKNGALCYAGNWKENHRHGLGVSFRSDDQSVHVGKWENGERTGMDFLFDKEGRLCVIRNSKDGKEEPKTIFCIDNSGTVISGLEVDPEDGRGNEFDEKGRLLYTGFHKNGLREGEGTSFYLDGRVEFTGQWRDGRFFDGVYFGPNGAGRFKAGDLNGTV